MILVNGGCVLLDPRLAYVTQPYDDLGEMILGRSANDA
jgi:hypothetical protein